MISIVYFNLLFQLKAQARVSIDFWSWKVLADLQFRQTINGHFRFQIACVNTKQKEKNIEKLFFRKNRVILSLPASGKVVDILKYQCEYI
jgi:hypothetical protein